MTTATTPARDSIPIAVTIETRNHIVWPFASMAVGDSFLVPAGVSRPTVAMAMQRAEKSGKGRFVSRTVAEGVRIWRFA
jgi:hypothetical protein